MLFLQAKLSPPLCFLGGVGVGQRFTLPESEGGGNFACKENSMFGFARPAGPDHGPKEDSTVKRSWHFHDVAESFVQHWIFLVELAAKRFSGPLDRHFRAVGNADVDLVVPGLPAAPTPHDRNHPPDT